MKSLNYILSVFTKGHKRSVRAKKNIVASLVFKGLDVLIGLMLVPLILGYLDQTKYGVWLTITSIVSWFGFMNIGLGHGLRNKLAEAIAMGEHKKAKIYVSTTYAILALIAVFFFSLFFFVNNFLPWAKILNVNIDINASLSILALIVFGAFSINLVAELIVIIIVADQKPAIKDAISLIGKILTLVTIFLFKNLLPSSLIYLGLAYTGLPLLVILISSVYFYKKKYKIYSPSIKNINFKYTYDLMSLGWKFFIIQISVMVLFMSDNIIIAQLFGPKEVIPYQIAHKYFGIVLMFFLIVISPMWSAYTEAFQKREFEWIRQIINKQNSFWYFIVFLLVLMTFFSNSFYIFWIGENVKIGLSLSICWALFVAIQSYNAIYTHFLNGVGKIKMQMYTAIGSIVINIPLSIFLAEDVNLGLNGVILATNFSIFIYAITRKIQYKKIIESKATGLWNE